MRHSVLGRRLAGAVTSAALVVVIAGCAPTPDAMPAPVPSFSSTYIAPPAFDLAPLTGEDVEVASLGHPSLAAKIDNNSSARPQVGLERSDLVFEELVEGGQTRYVAVWHSDIPEEIGPVRSIRPMDPDIISPFGGMVAYSGGQYQFVVLMQNTNVRNAIHGYSDMDDIMYRTRSKPSPHDVLVRAQLLIGRNGDLAPPAQQFAFAPDLASSSAVREGVETLSAAVRFSSSATPSWDYEADSGRWLRSQLGVPDLDSAGGQLSADNVVVLRVPISHDLGVPKTELIGSGDAWVLSGGKAITAVWAKSSQQGIISLHDAEGTVIRLAPGNTWIELMPDNGTLSLSHP